MMTKYSVGEIKAVAEAAITTRHTADAAKVAFDAAPTDDALKAAWETAESQASTAKAAADALSQETTELTPEQIAKKKRKIAIIKSELREAGAIDDDEEDDDDQDEDLDRPVTFRDLDQREKSLASQSAKQMAEAIQDAAAKAAVLEALTRIVPSGDPQKDFTDAVSIANRDKNSKILEELGRRPRPAQHRSGAGAPARAEDAAFEPTADEKRFMLPPFSLTKEEILKARPTE